MKVTRILATIPARDLRRAQAFYEDKLGLHKREERPDGIEYGAGDGSGFLLFESSGAPSGTHTQIGFEVDDLMGAVKELKGKGVRFEEYDFPGFKTVDGVAEVNGAKGAWFKDTEGNLAAVAERVPARVSS